MDDESGVTRNIIDELLPSDIQGARKEGGSSITRRIIDERHSWDAEVDQMVGESGVT